MDLRTVPSPGLLNFRDLGGHRGLWGLTVHFRRLYRSDSLHRLNDADLEWFGRLGIRSVLDLRRPREVERDGRVPDLPGLQYHNVHPEHREWNADLYDPAAGSARYLADRYLDMAEEGIEGIGAALRLIADPSQAPMVMHCFAGKDRTGVLSALVLRLLGVSEHDVATDYALSDAAQAPLTARMRLDRPGHVAPAQFTACPPQAMLLFLAGLCERYGSVYAYAIEAGVSDRQIDSLRNHLLG